MLWPQASPLSEESFSSESSSRIKAVHPAKPTLSGLRKSLQARSSHLFAWTLHYECHVRFFITFLSFSGFSLGGGTSWIHT